MAYAIVADLRAQIDKTSAADDVVLLAVLNAATMNIDKAINRYLPGR